MASASWTGGKVMYRGKLVYSHEIPKNDPLPPEPTISVNAPDGTPDTTPTITGTTNQDAQVVIDVIVTDAEGAVQTLTALTWADGSWRATPAQPLADGPYQVLASMSHWRRPAPYTAADVGSINPAGTAGPALPPAPPPDPAPVPAPAASLSAEAGTDASGTVLLAQTVTDDGAGMLAGGGEVDYASSTLWVPGPDTIRGIDAYAADHEDAAAFEGSDWLVGSGRGGEYISAPGQPTLKPAEPIVVRYRTAGAARLTHSMTLALPAVSFDLTPYTTDEAVPGSVQFKWMSHVYEDFEGVIYRARTPTSPGVASGTINYRTGIVLMTDWIVGGSGPEDFQLISLWTRKRPWTTASLFFNVAEAPLRPGAGSFALSVVDVEGSTLTAEVDGAGAITGPHMRGKLEFARGGCEVQFGDYVDDATLTDADRAEWWYRAADVGAVEPGKIWRPWPVLPDTLRYSAVSYVYLPVDVALMGLDPTALPPDGRVPFARAGDTAVVGLTISGPAFAAAVGMVYDVGQAPLSLIQVLDAATGAEIHTGYSVDLDAGKATFADVTGYPAQVQVRARIEVYRQIAEVHPDGRVRFTMPVGYGFAAGAVFSTALRQGDRYARVSRMYDQQSWDGVTWADGQTGAAAVGTYDQTNYPPSITNRGAITERWALRLRANGQDFDLIGQHAGQVAAGNINADFAPANPARGEPYFTLDSDGWGSGWAAGNVLFIDTVGAESPIAIIRTTQPSSPARPDYHVLLEQRGSVDNPPGTSF